jgi:alkylhydroperoxidase family enzyme
VFLAIYVREAHPVEGWRSPGNDRAGIIVNQPKSKKERIDVANLCSSALEMTMPLLVDEIDDRVGHAYSGMPDRMYVIDRNGRVTYKGGRGPFGFKPGEMEQSLAMTLLEQSPANTQTRLPMLDDREAWNRLPLVGPDAGKPLPEWARVTATSLPGTTAAMLELDYLHRVKSPLDAKLRAKMRWVAAHANRCEYIENQALDDLRRAGGTAAEVKQLQGGPTTWPSKDRPALTFADTLTRSAFQVTDDDVARLVKEHGEKQVVAMVLLLAYANFQDRLLLTLGCSPRPEGQTFPPLELRVDRDRLAKVPRMARVLPPESAPPILEPDPEWSAFDFERLQRQLSTQKERPGRVRVPSWEEVQKGLPPGAPTRPIHIKWSLVCMGYQPQLASAWSACTRTFGQEAKQDRVFEESLFWVVTRSLQCFY